jgi:hypothetical protein
MYYSDFLKALIFNSNERFKSSGTLGLVECTMAEELNTQQHCCGTSDIE